MSSRQQYFRDLLTDCQNAVEEFHGGLSPEQALQLIASLILSDSLNGVRRALLDLADATRQGGRG